MNSEPRTTWVRDGLIGLSTGILYGTTSVLVGAPFDSIKTKMQAQAGYVDNSGMATSFRRVIAREGFFSLYRGVLSPLIGSGIYRASQFAVFEAVFTRLATSNSPHFPPSASLSNNFINFDSRVFVAGFLASTVRSILECPIELVKVRRQTGQSWHLKEIYRGFPFQWARTTMVMVPYFIMFDGSKRKFPEFIKTPVGQFVISAGAATIGFWFAWPFEVLKNQSQADFSIPKENGNSSVRPTFFERIRFILKSQGVAGFYRGIWPGTIRSIISNGSGMVVMGFANKKITEWGLRK